MDVMGGLSVGGSGDDDHKAHAKQPYVDIHPITFHFLVHIGLSFFSLVEHKNSGTVSNC